MTSSRLYYGLTLFGYFTVMLIILAWYGWLAPPKAVSPAWAITLLVLPLFTALRGLLHINRRTIAWSLFLSFLYFSHGVTEAWSVPAARPWALIEVFASLCWLIGGILYLRSSNQ